jgi:hypothetical protein
MVMRGRLAQALFIAACVGVTWYAWSSWSDALPQYKNEALIIPTALLYTMTFPASLAVQLIYTGLALVTPIDRLSASPAFLTWMFMTWGPLAVAGYLQWFVLVPGLVRRWRGQGAAPSVICQKRKIILWWAAVFVFLLMLLYNFHLILFAFTYVNIPYLKRWFYLLTGYAVVLLIAIIWSFNKAKRLTNQREKSNNEKSQ